MLVNARRQREAHSMRGEPIQLADYTGECEVVGEGDVHIPEGRYELALVGWRTAWIFKRGKLILEFRIVTLGKHFGSCLRRYYNVGVIKPLGKHGHFKARRSSNFVREYAALFGAPRRIDRIPMRPFESVIIQGHVKTVDNARGRKIPEAVRYSIVDELLQVEAGSGK